MTLTHEEQAKKMEEVWEEISFLREQGQAEYARDENNAHSNFEWVADMLNRGREHEVTREDVLMVYALKHLDGIMSYLNGHEGQREDVRGRINDLIVYLVLLRGMVDDNENEEDLQVDGEDRKERGTVRWFDPQKGYGFIESDSRDEEVYAHFNHIQQEGFKSLKDGERVKFDVEIKENGPTAVNIEHL